MVVNGKKEFHILGQGVLDLIDTSLAFSRGSPISDIANHNRAIRYLESEAIRHSVDIELAKKGRGAFGRKFKLATRNLQTAFDIFLRRYGYSKELEEGLLLDSASTLEPSLKHIHYRFENEATTMAALPNGEFHIYPQNVADQMAKFVYENNSIKHPVESAVHAHFHIARIHPFRDGNGRLARLVQNGILASHHYPPIIITRNEKPLYLSLIHKAQKSYDEHGRLTLEQTPFFSFLANNMVHSIKEIKRKTH